MAVLPRVSIQAASSSGDTLIAAVSDGGTLVFDRGAHVRWRDSMFGTASRIAAISPDGRKVAVVTRDSVGLHDLVTGRSKVLGIHSATAARYRTNYVVWSNDGRRFAVYRVDWDVPDSALLWVFTRDGKAAAQPRRLEANYGENLFWMGDTVVLVASPYLPDLRKWIHQKPWSVGPCKVTAVTLRGHLQTWMVQGRFGGDDVWYQQGRHLVCVDKSRGYAAVFQVPVQ
jgi:hypothetical protein